MGKLRVAQFGTFDVDNYGDLLFPYIARWRCPDYEWVSVSPLACTTSFADCLPAVSLAEAERMDFDAVVVGGGNIVSAKRSGLPAYAQVAGLAYPALWIGAAALAARRRIPLVFNAPSIARAFGNPEERAIARAVFASSAYVALRDPGSSQIVKAILPSAEPALVPDSAFDLQRMWPEDPEAFRAGRGYVAVHVNARYCGSVAQTAAALDALCEKIGLDARFVPIGPCHGDLELAAAVAGAMRGAASVAPPTSLRAMYRDLLGARLYAGASMHGFITSLCSGVPATLLLGGKVPMRKFEGMLADAGLRIGDAVSGWGDVMVGRVMSAVFTPEAEASVSTRLDEHWRKLREAIVSGPPCEAPRWIRSWRPIVGAVQWREKLVRAGISTLRKVIG